MWAALDPLAKLLTFLTLTLTFYYGLGWALSIAGVVPSNIRHEAIQLPYCPTPAGTVWGQCDWLLFGRHV